MLALCLVSVVGLASVQAKKFFLQKRARIERCSCEQHCIGHQQNVASSEKEKPAIRCFPLAEGTTAPAYRRRIHNTGGVFDEHQLVTCSTQGVPFPYASQQEKLGLSQDFLQFCFQACKPTAAEDGASCTSLCDYNLGPKNRYAPGPCVYVPSNNGAALEPEKPAIAKGPPVTIAGPEKKEAPAGPKKPKEAKPVDISEKVKAIAKEADKALEEGFTEANDATEVGEAAAAGAGEAAPAS